MHLLDPFANQDLPVTAIATQHSSQSHAYAMPQRRFERVAVSSIFGDPMDRRTWSAAPYNVASCLQKLGIAVEGIYSGVRGASAACSPCIT